MSEPEHSEILGGLAERFSEHEMVHMEDLRGRENRTLWKNGMGLPPDIVKAIKDHLPPFSFMSTDMDVIAQLPECIAHEFPAVLTPKCGLDVLVVDLLCAFIENRACFEPIHKILVESHALRYYRSLVKFLSMVKEERKRDPHSDVRIEPTRDFLGPSDPAGYYDFVPSTAYLQSVAEKRHFARRPLEERFQNCITGKRFAGDHSFKIALRILMRLPKSALGIFVKPFSCFYNWVTENRQLAHQRFAVTKSRAEIAPITEELRARCGQDVEVSV